MNKPQLITIVALGLLAVQTWAADKSLVLYLPFDEGVGATAEDVSSYRNAGTVVGNALWVAGPKGMALEFVNGSHVTIQEIPEYDVTAEVSLLAWVKATTVPNWARVIDKSQWQTTGFDLVLTQNVGLPRLEFFVNNTTSLVDGTTAVIDNEWHFIVGTFGNKMLRIYVDGVRQGEAQSTGQVDINPNDWPLMIGGESSSNGGQQFLGSIDEVAMYNRELSAEEVMGIFQKGMPLPDSATDPQPKNEAVDVPCDVVLSWTAGGFAASHDVYLGTSLDAVNTANRTTPMEVLVSEGQTATEYEPTDLLEYGQTYYWRVDEVGAAPDNTVVKGDVWSFTAEPFAYPITNLMVDASSQQLDSPAIRTIDGSGLNVATDQHGVDTAQMWMSAAGLPAWIQYTFDKEYKLDKLWVWNANSRLEYMGFGAKDVTIEYSTDGETWTAVENVPQFTQGTGADTYTHNTTVDLGGVTAKHVRLTVTATWGMGIASLSEVRFFYVPLQAFGPQPADGATSVSVETDLDWRPGREATSHAVYIDTDSNAVADGAVSGHTVTDHGYTPEELLLGTEYFWKVDEVGGTGAYAGDVWSFTTEDFIVVDDFESYTNDMEAETTIWHVWIDGLTDKNSGSTVGWDEAPFAERTLVHGGEQSMPLRYDNTSFAFSEATRPFDSAQDWTQHGVTTLVLYFRGQITNSAATLYLKIDDTKVSFSGSAVPTTLGLWKQWAIPLAATGANLKSVKGLTIGVEGSGTGTVFIDDIRLYAAAPEAVGPTDPGTAGLMALYTMDGNAQDTSGKNYHGTISGDVSYEAGYAGQAMIFNGINAYMDLPIGPMIASLTNMTVATHVYFGGGSGGWQRIFDFGSGTSAYMFFCPRTGTTGNMRFAIRSATVTTEQLVNSPSILTVGWHHTAVVIDSQAMTIRLYLDGELIASGATIVLPKDLGNTTQNWLGRSQYSADAYLLGSLDDFRIYDRVLSEAELRYLVGDR